MNVACHMVPYMFLLISEQFYRHAQDYFLNRRAPVLVRGASFLMKALYTYLGLKFYPVLGLTALTYRSGSPLREVCSATLPGFPRWPILAGD